MSERVKLAPSVPGRIAREASPELESCGLLLSVGDGRVIDDFLAFPGPLARDRFELPPEWVAHQVWRQRQAGRCIVGFYHTHPKGRSVEPSLADRAGHPPGARVLIVAEKGWAFYGVAWQGESWQRIDSGTFALSEGFFS